MKSIIIFAGAGASRGVNQDKYPMAVDFFYRLPDEIKNSQLFQQLHLHLSNNKSQDIVDIEHILWELGQLEDALNEFLNPTNFASYLLSSNQIHQIAPQSLSGQSIKAQFEALKSIVNDLKNRINERVYEFYSQIPTANELRDSWLPLLEKVISKHFDKIDIVTTNYDLIIESALQELDVDKINPGFNQRVYPGIDLFLWRFDHDLKSQGLLTKLHGSVDWKLGNGDNNGLPVIRRGHPEFDGDHDKRLILYPGFKGVPAKDPFILFHEYLKRISKNATHLIFIGFAFRDDYINEIFESNLRSETRILVINPCDELPKLPFLDKAIHIKEGFGVNENSTGEIKQFSTKSIEAWLTE